MTESPELEQGNTTFDSGFFYLKGQYEYENSAAVRALNPWEKLQSDINSKQIETISSLASEPGYSLANLTGLQSTIDYQYYNQPTDSVYATSHSRY